MVLTLSTGSLRERNSPPDGRSRSFTSLLRDPAEASRVPSGEKTRAVTTARPCKRVFSKRPETASHSLTFWSAPAEARRSPAGE